MEQDHTSDLILFVLKRGFSYSYSESCNTYKDFISIFSWNEKTGIVDQSNVRCEYRSSFPVQYSLRESKRFTVTVHMEYRWYTDTDITEAKSFFVSKGMILILFLTKGFIICHVCTPLLRKECKTKLIKVFNILFFERLAIGNGFMAVSKGFHPIFEICWPLCYGGPQLSNHSKLKPNCK